MEELVDGGDVELFTAEDVLERFLSLKAELEIKLSGEENDEDELKLPVEDDEDSEDEDDAGEKPTEESKKEPTVKGV